MRVRIPAIVAVFGLTGCTAVLGLDERPLDPTADAGTDVALGDSASADADDDTLEPSDSADEDSTVADVDLPDTPQPDTSKADTTATPDTTTVDTKPEKDTSVPDTAVMDTAPPPVDTGAPDTMTPTGLLTISSASISSEDVSLTSEGTLDWAHWGLGTSSTWNHRVTGGFIAKGAVSGTAGSTALSMKRFVWSNGTPTTSASTPDGITLNATGESYTFTVVASPTMTRTLRIYVGWYSKAQGTVSAALSDGSATPVALDGGGSTAGVDYTRFVVTFRAVNPVPTLTIKITRNGSLGGAGGSLDFFAATLQ